MAEQRIILNPTLNNKYEAFWETHRARVAKAIRNSFKELKEFKQEVFMAKSYFLIKEQGHRRPSDHLKYLKNPSLNLKYKGITSSAPPLTKHGSKGYTKGEDGAIMP